MVLTSLRCGTLESVSSSLVSKPAHMSGSAAFFAPEIRISPESETPPWMMSLSIRHFFGGQRMHRQGVNLLPRALAERRVHGLMPLDLALAGDRFADDERLEVVAGAQRAHLPA